MVSWYQGRMGWQRHYRGKSVRVGEAGGSNNKPASSLPDLYPIHPIQVISLLIGAIDTHDGAFIIHT